MIFELDRAIFLFFNQAAHISSFVDRLICFFGSNYSILAAAALAIIWYFFVASHAKEKSIKKLVQILFMVIMATVLARFVIAEPLRFFLDRTRPFEVIEGARQIIAHSGGHAFPSGHASAAFAIASSLGYFIPQARWFLLSIAILNAISRVAGGVHWPSDVIAGAAIGILSAFIEAWANKFLWFSKKSIS